VIFLSQDNEPVARINGYRNVADFKQVLDYVDAKAYASQTLSRLSRRRTSADGARLQLPQARTSKRPPTSAT
jgi:hypothetical protein